MIEMSATSVEFLFSSLDTGLQHALMETPDGMLFLCLLGPVMVN